MHQVKPRAKNPVGPHGELSSSPASGKKRLARICRAAQLLVQWTARRSLSDAADLCLYKDRSKSVNSR